MSTEVIQRRVRIVIQNRLIAKVFIRMTVPLFIIQLTMGQIAILVRKGSLARPAAAQSLQL